MLASSDSDSSVEDLEERKRLSEAVVTITQNEKSIATNCNNTDKIWNSAKNKKFNASKHKEKPSLRPNATDEEPERSPFPPGVQKFVASKLSEQLEREIELSDRSNGVVQQPEDTGIRLFLSSAIKLKTDGDDENKITTKPPIRKRTYSSSSNSSEDDRLKEAAVSHDFVMKHSALSTVTMETSETIVAKDNQGSNIDTNSDKKKKKKKKKHKEELKVT